MFDHIRRILTARPVARCAGDVIGRSREGRAIRAFRFGHGDQRVSLLGGCHADEPVGPRMLRHLVGHLSLLPAGDELLGKYDWWIVPHINPDGDERNRHWYRDDDAHVDLIRYLLHVTRELPGDDIEFGFPRDEYDDAARPENRAVSDWWREAGASFALHVSLHGMGFAAGPWFLIEAAWRDRCQRLKQRCMSRVHELGYALHDVERNGEKGFFRLERGFCTRPDSRYMRQHFLELGDEETAGRFRPSSMETIRSFGGDALTLVSEMPLFLTPGVGETLGPPDPVAKTWKKRVDDWRLRLAQEDCDQEVARAAEVAGLRPMPIAHQMNLQLTLIAAGLEQVELVNDTGPLPETAA